MGIASVGSIEYDARIKTDKLKQDAAEVDRHAKNAGDSIGDNVDRGSNRAGDAIKNFAKVAAVALAATGAAAVAFGVSSAKAFIESQNAIAQTEAVIKSTGGAAGVTAKEVTNLANSFQRQTRYSDETIRSAENMLLTFTNIGKKTFPGATEAVLDMATAMGTDLKSTAIQVGKALQDPVLGATALQRVGVRLTQTQKDLIQSMVDSGDAAGAQAVILKELQTEFGGSAKAAGETFAGRLDILKNQLGEVQEGIGELIIRGITPLVTGMLKWYDAAGGVDGILTTLKGTVGGILPQLKQWATVIFNIATQIAEYLAPKLAALWNTVSTQLIPILKELWLNVLQPLIPVIGTVLVVALGAAITALNILIAAFVWTYNAIKEGNPIIWALIGVFGALAAAMAFNAVFNALNTGFAVMRLVTIPSVIASIGALQAAVLAPMVMPALAVGAALASIALVYNKIKETQALLDRVNGSIIANNNADTQAMQKVADDYKAGRISKAAYQRFFQSLTQRASGGPVSAGTPYVVGEKRPELFVPRQSGTIIPDLSMVGGGKSVTVNIDMKGIMARSRSDLRDIGKDIVRSINEELGAKGQALIGGGNI